MVACLDASAAAEIFRYDGITGAFIDIFIEEGSGGLGEPTFIIFAPQVVSEPGTLALLGVGLLALAFRQRCRGA